jgi:putative two-component system response regulator
MTNFDIQSSCILIVDDKESIVDLLRGILESDGYHNLVSTTDPRVVNALCQEHSPDLILLDLHMPHLSGIELLQKLAGESLGGYLPVLVLTSDITPEAKQSALRIGAKDFLLKPFDTTEVLLRVRNLLEIRALYKQLTLHGETLDQRVRDRTRQLAEAQVEILNHLAVVSEYQDDDTSQHTKRIGAMAGMVARALGQSEEQIELIRLAAPLHDIGKVGVPNHILLRADQLMPSEYEIMRSHTTVGGEILAKSKFPILQLARESRSIITNGGTEWATRSGSRASIFPCQRESWPWPILSTHSHREGLTKRQFRFKRPRRRSEPRRASNSTRRWCRLS